VRHLRVVRRLVPVLIALRGSGPDADQRARAATNELTRTLRTVGGGYAKLGQVLAARPDLLPEHVRAELAPLLDHAADPCDTHKPMDTARLIGSGCIADVYMGPEYISPESHRQVPLALKVIRPSAAHSLRADLRLAGWVVRAAECLPTVRGLPLRVGFEQVAAAARHQADLARELQALRFFHEAFSGWDDIIVPEPVEERCGPGLLVMEHLEGLRRIDDKALEPTDVQCAARTALRALLEMLFVHGWVHCDMHPGNLLVSGRRLVLLDFGLMAEISAAEREALADLFVAIALDDPLTALDAILREAVFVPPALNLDALETDVSAVVAAASRKPVAEFLVGRFALDLFEVQRRHGIRGSANLALALTALLSLEGVLQCCAPALDFQREALPYALDAVVGTDGRRAWLTPPVETESIALEVDGGT